MSDLRLQNHNGSSHSMQRKTVDSNNSGFKNAANGGGSEGKS